MKRRKLLTLLLLFVASIAGAIAIYNTSSINTPPPLLVFPEGSDYEQAWSKVDSLHNKGLVKSALEVIDDIYNEAMSDHNYEQVAKAVIHKLKFNSYIQEEDFELAINDLDSLAKTAPFPLKQVIHSLNAEIYWGYYQNNYWKFSQRSHTVNFDNTDIRTWSLEQIADQVIKNYMASLENADELKRVPIKTFDAILIKGNADYLRSSLYDFLAHRAFDFLRNSEVDLTKPAYRFEIKDEKYFGDADAFIAMQVTTPDSMSTKYYAVKILQDLTRLHINDKDPSALVDIELKRLRFANTYAVIENKEQRYYDALKRLETFCKDHVSSTEVMHQLAQYHYQRGMRYNPAQSQEFKDELKIAHKICVEANTNYPKSYGADLCRNLLSSIEEKAMNFSLEEVSTPGKPFRTLFTYKNVKRVYFKVVRLDPQYHISRNNNRYGKELIQWLNKKEPVKEWLQELPDEGDYQSHAVELKMPELNYGHYMVMAGSDKEFSGNEQAVAYASFWSSNISYVNRKNADETLDFTVFHRTTGMPLKGVNAQLYYRKYNYVSRKYEVNKAESYTTNQDGGFTVPTRGRDSRYVYVEFTKDDDRYFNASEFYQYRRNNQEPRAHIVTHFYTDRGIYRPGQTIYFKGIVLESKGESHKIKANYTTTVTLYDVNGQKVEDVKLTTNEFGTVSGSFTAPMGVLNGQMRISDKHGSKYFSVEEYKRPKFEVEFLPVKGSYKLGQQVTVKGTAKAYAGANIDGANVTYRVTRYANFPYWVYYRWGYYPYSSEIEITNGTTTTDENGAFVVDFTALADNSVDAKFRPTYNYTVTADVTDINGETHSANTWVYVGYNAMNLSVNVPGRLNVLDENKFQVSTTNLNGEKVNAKGTIKIVKLKEHPELLRSRQWQKPDLHLLSKEEYRKAFPVDIYSDELNSFQWKEETVVMETTFDTKKTNDLHLDNLSKWKQGYYKLEAASTDSFGVEVIEEKYFTVFNEKSKQCPENTFHWFARLKDHGEPGEQAEFLIGSRAKNVKVLCEIEHKEEIVSKQWLTLSNEQRKITVPIEEKHRGNFAIHFTFVKENRCYTQTEVVYVPRTNKQLDMEFSTFRNKLLPGQEEEWKVKIKSKNGDKVAAEMLATMYDASLDEFRSNYFGLNIYQSYYARRNWSAYHGFSYRSAQLFADNWNRYHSYEGREYDYLNWFNFDRYRYSRYSGYEYQWDFGEAEGNMPMAMDETMAEEDAPSPDGAYTMTIADANGASATISNNTTSRERERGGETDKLVSGLVTEQQKGETGQSGKDLGKVKARTNLNETAFFYPQLQTNEAGEVIIKFTIPEALTRWKFLGMAHTKDLQIGTITESVVTQKELMVMPNPPRFFRESDKMTFSAKVSNLAEEDQTGTAQLFLFDAITMKPLDQQFKLSNAQQSFSVKQGQSTALNWNIEIPEGIQAVTYRMVAKAGKFSDGEEMALPVLTNRMLVTESLPLPMKGKGSKTFTLKKLMNSGKSKTLKNHKLTLEYTSNPAWYAIQAMPYMMEYPYECAEQTFTRYYANSLATHIMNSNPKIKKVFDSWKQNSKEAFLSNLEKNQELKALLLEETPWVVNAQDEAERKNRIALLFDLNKMSNELARAMDKLQKAQVSNGGWPWFPGMPESRYITQHIVTGMGHLDRLGVKNVREDRKVWGMVQNGVRYLDQRIIEDYQYVKKHWPDSYRKNKHITNTQIQYLYARSYFMDLPVRGQLKEAVDYYKEQTSKYWLDYNIYMEGMMAISMHRMDEKTLANDIVKSLKERALTNDEMGMYWKDLTVGGYYWYQAPIETQALLIEVFDEVANDQAAVEEMKVWLLKQKQTQDWKTTKATAEACYALLLKGTDWLSDDDIVEVKVGTIQIVPTTAEARDEGNKRYVTTEAGTGYFKTSWNGNAITPDMGSVSVTKKTDGVAWGALYWQYFEQLDKITPHETPLKLNKQLFLEQLTNAGPVITPVTEKTTLKPGDKIKVRIELRVDRAMEYVHMKDMRAAGFEPTNVISSYRYQDGLGYYQSTRDAATNFFMDYMAKGTYVFEYDLRVSHKGNFSNGVTTIQCMYAPEFTSHSEGIRVQVGK